MATARGVWLFVASAPTLVLLAGCPMGDYCEACPPPPCSAWTTWIQLESPLSADLSPSSPSVDIRVGAQITAVCAGRCDISRGLPAFPPSPTWRTSDPAVLRAIPNGCSATLVAKAPGVARVFADGMLDEMPEPFTAEPSYCVGSSFQDSCQRVPLLIRVVP